MKEHIHILGVRFDAATADRAAAAVVDCARSALREGAMVVTPNPEAVMLAKSRPPFAEALRGARFSFADGTGVVLAARRLGTPLPMRVRGVDLSFEVLTRLDTQGAFSVFFLGGQTGVAEKAAENMQKRFPNMHTAGAHHGFFLKDPQQEAALLEQINAAAPDILLLCLGMPRAEEWAAANALRCGAVLCVGGTMDVMAGTVRLAPAWIRAIGMEWLYRLLCQPSRFVRMLSIPKFIFAIMKESRKK
jgi:N-acetylglucosaminyldiphosphoundecaprenol N-acetyl-beta-D-mannosaminyltransferase